MDRMNPFVHRFRRVVQSLIILSGKDGFRPSFFCDYFPPLQKSLGGGQCCQLKKEKDKKKEKRHENGFFSLFDFK